MFDYGILGILSNLTQPTKARIDHLSSEFSQSIQIRKSTFLTTVFVDLELLYSDLYNS